jgi:hypothetical protein
MEIKITKRRLLWHQSNDMCCNWYWEVRGQIINDQRTRYRKFCFVVHYDYEDIAEWFEPENDECPAITKKMHREYLDELIYGSFTSYINSYDDCKLFGELCNESIERYNNIIARCA